MRKFLFILLILLCSASVVSADGHTVNAGMFAVDILENDRVVPDTLVAAEADVVEIGAVADSLGSTPETVTVADSIVTDSVSEVFAQWKYNILAPENDDFKKAELIVDSLKMTGMNLDSVKVDSLARRYFTETLIVERGIIPAYNIDGNAYTTFRLDSMIKAARKEQIIQEKIRAKEERRLNKTRLDTLPMMASTLIAIPVPGFSQIYNRQYWKLPILYGGVGGFVYGGIHFGKKYCDSKYRYDALVANSDNATSDEIVALNVEYMRNKNNMMLMYMGAAVTYLYFLADGVWNYDYPVKSTTKATLLAIFIPGAGQIYNKAYWKLPILYGGAAALGYVINYNAKGYTRFKRAYDIRMQNNPNIVDEFNGVSDEQLLTTRNNYRRYRDMAIFYSIGLYALSIIDAYVDASLNTYDISDLALRVEPMCDFQNLRFASGASPTPVAGLSFKLTF